MALSKLQIWNMAIAELPDARLDTLDDVSIAGEACKDQYQPSIELLLEDHPYDFAIVRKPLALLSNDRANEWGYAYQLPADMAAPRYLLPYAAGEVVARPVYAWGRSGGVPIRIAGGRLYTGQDAATLEYVTNAPSESVFTAKFARALALELASRIVMPVKKDQARQEKLVRMAEVARERAKADDMNRDRESVRDFIPEVQLVREGLSWR